MLSATLYDLSVGGSDYDGREAVKRVVGKQEPDQVRSRLRATLRVLQARNPFDAVSGTQANLLQTLKQAIERGDQELGQQTLDGITEEITSLNSSIAQEVGQNRGTAQLGLWVAVASLVLTLVLGLPLLAQWVAQVTATRG